MITNGEFECVGNCNGDVYTDRLLVPGGWVLRTIAYEFGLNSKAASVHTIFIKDENYEWEIKKEK